MRSAIVRKGEPATPRAANDPRSRLFAAIANDAREWAGEDRRAELRVILLLYLAWLFFGYLRDPHYGSIFGGISLGIHELGHLLFGWAPQFLQALGGTLAEVAAPLAAAVMFLRQRDYFAMSVAGLWLSYALFGVATYVGDARAMELPLVSVGGGEVFHDWDVILTTLGAERLDGALAGLTRVCAFVVGSASIAFGVWICWRIVAARHLTAVR